MTQKMEISKVKLEELYVRRKLSTNVIGKMYGCWGSTISVHLKEFGIERRNPKKSLKLDRQLLEDLYIRKHNSPYQIADRLGCAPNTIRRWLRVHNFTIRKKKLIKISKARLEYLYREKRHSLAKIGELLGHTASGLFEVFKKYGIATRTTS